MAFKMQTSTTSPCSGGLNSPWPDRHRTGQEPELWSPASFMSQMKAGSEQRGDQPVNCHKGVHSQDSEQNSVKKLRLNLLSPEDLVGKGSHQTAAEGKKREHSSREEKLERKVEVELLQIQQQMQYYYSRKQELKCCQQQAQILQQWLEMSTQPGAQDVQGVQEELGQLQVRISTLTKAQLAERQHVQALLARLREIQLALDL